MTIDTERLKTDAAYWRECGAPEDATHYEPGEQDPECWAKIVGDRIMHWSPVEEWHVWNPKGMDGKFIPRPTKPAAPEWDGASVKHIGMKFQSSLGVCELMAIDSNNVTCCVRFVDSGHLQFCSLDALEPIRTKEQRERDELAHLLCPALRQLRHNSSDGFVPAFDYEETLAILSRYNLEPKP